MTERRCWGYSLTDSKIFTLYEGESMPDGYFDSPAKVKAKPNPKATRKAKA